MNKIKYIFLIFLLILGFNGCKSINQPDSVIENLDYSNEAIVQNEINQIRKLTTIEPVKALWRASFLKNNEIIDEMLNNCINSIEKAIENKDYENAITIYNSINVFNGYENKDLEKKIYNLKKDDMPGSAISKNYLPKTIANCVEGTVTVWVDKGVKVENGVGQPDIVIGSGFFIDQKGYIVTNHHVIADCVDSKNESFTRLYVKLPDDMDTKIPAKVIGYDPIIDLALLKVEITPPFVFELGSSNDLHVGDKISVIGTPIGLEGTLTSGIISNTDRKITTLGSVLQIDAAVNSGNSGGPLIDSQFRVQAIVFAGMLQFQGLNFAIPVEYLKQELPLLFNGGEVKHSWIGAYGHTYKEKGKKVGLEVQYVAPGLPAHFAGLKPGAIIVEINNEKVTSLESFHFNLMSQFSKSIVKCKYLLDGQEFETLLYLEKRNEKPAVLFFNSDYLTDSFIPLFGLKLVPASTSNRKSYRIVNVIKGSIADELGFSEHDPITVNDVRIDYRNEMIISQIYIQRKTKGYLDVSMYISVPFDSSNYF